MSTTADTPKRPRVAVIGSGIAGLSLAYVLGHPANDFDVTIYEVYDRLGMDSQSILFEGKSYADGTFNDNVGGERHDGGADTPHFTDAAQPTTTAANPSEPRVRIDMPLRVFSPRYYPHLTALFDTTGIEYTPENYQSSFTTQSGDAIFTYRNLLLGNVSLPYINPADLFSKSAVTRDVIKFLATAPLHLRNGRLPVPQGFVTSENVNDDTFLRNINTQPTQQDKVEKEETLLEYLLNEGYSEEFIYLFELPTIASICTCSLQAAAQYPAYIILSYQTRRGGGGVRRVVSGANHVVKVLSQYAKIRCNACVLQINHIPKTTPDGEDQVAILDSQQRTDVYDYVVFATQANQTAKVLRTSICGGTGSNSPTTPVRGGLDNDGTNHNNKNTSPLLQAQLPPATIHPQWPQMHDVLTRIPYESSELVLHGDDNLMPRDPKDWRSVNFVLPDDIEHLKAMSSPTQNAKKATTTPTSTPNNDNNDNNNDNCSLQNLAIQTNTTTPSESSDNSGSSDDDESEQLKNKWLTTISHQPSQHAQRLAMCNAKYVPQSEGMSTIWMNQVQNGINTERRIYQTWNPLSPTHLNNNNNGEEYQIQNLYGRSFFQRPIATFDSVKACSSLWKEFQGAGNIYCVGSFSVGGIPLLELAVVSSLAVAQRLNAKNILKYNNIPTKQSEVDMAQNANNHVVVVKEPFAISTLRKIPVVGSHPYTTYAIDYYQTKTVPNMIIEVVTLTIFYLLTFCGYYQTPQQKKKIE